MSTITVRQFATVWRSGRGGPFVSAVWEKGRRRLINRFVRVHEDRPLIEICAEHIWNMQKELRDAGRTPGTVNRNTAAVMAFIRDAELVGNLPRGTHEQLQMQIHYLPDRRTKRFHPFTLEQREEILRVFEVHNPKYFQYVAFLLLVGGRISEAVALEWDDIDLGAKYADITKSWSDGCPGLCKTPKSVRPAKLPARLIEILARTPKPQRVGLLFKTPTGKRIDTNRFSRTIWPDTIAWARIEIPRLPPRCSRHTWVTLAYEIGHLPSSDVSRQTGTSPEVLDRCYRQYTEEFQRLDVDRAIAGRLEETKGGPEL